MRLSRAGGTPSRYIARIIHIRTTVRTMPSRFHRRADVVTRAAQACDASRALHPSRKLEVFAQLDFGEAAEALEDFAPHEDRLVAGAGTADSRAEADHRADDPVGQGARRRACTSKRPPTTAGSDSADRDVSGKGRRHYRIGVHEDRTRRRAMRVRPHSSDARGRATLTISVSHNGCAMRDARVAAAAVNDDDLGVSERRAKRAQRARDRRRLVEHRHDYRKFFQFVSQSSGGFTSGDEFGVAESPLMTTRRPSISSRPC